MTIVYCDAIPIQCQTHHLSIVHTRHVSIHMIVQHFMDKNTFHISPNIFYRGWNWQVVESWCKTKYRIVGVFSECTILNTFKSGALLTYTLWENNVQYRNRIYKSPILSEMNEWHGRKGWASQAAESLIRTSYHINIIQ